MTASPSIDKAKRTRSSKTAIANALAALKEAGLSVEKLCISGGQVEIQIADIERGKNPQDYDGEKSWD